MLKCDLEGQELILTNPLNQARLYVKHCEILCSQHTKEYEILLRCKEIRESEHCCKQKEQMPKYKCPNEKIIPYKNIIFNPPATIICWKDGTKTVVKCDPKDAYDPMLGMLYCFVKKQYGNTSRGLNNILHDLEKYADKYYEGERET